MINKHMIGRLGNQMFQYATVRAFQLRNNIDDEINLNFDEIFARADEGGFEDSLSYFRIEKYGIKKIKKSFKQKVLLDYLNLIKAFLGHHIGIIYSSLKEHALKIILISLIDESSTVII